MTPQRLLHTGKRITRYWIYNLSTK